MSLSDSKNPPDSADYTEAVRFRVPHGLPSCYPPDSASDAVVPEASVFAVPEAWDAVASAEPSDAAASAVPSDAVVAWAVPSGAAASVVPSDAAAWAEPSNAAASAANKVPAEVLQTWPNAWLPACVPFHKYVSGSSPQRGWLP